MKRYTHAWLATRAIDRLGKLAENVLQKAKDNYNKAQAKAQKEPDPKKKKQLLKDADEALLAGQSSYDSIMNLQTMLKKQEFTRLVVQGTWIPDNIIKDNGEGHIWKYQPPLRQGKDIRYLRDGEECKGYVVEEGKTFYRYDHAKTSSLCFEEAKNTYAWDKPWFKTGGFLADRCEAVHQTIRDLFLFQENEMHKLVATLIFKYGDDLLNKQEEVKQFLTDPSVVKAYYDQQTPGKKYLNREEIIKIRNQIGCDEDIDKRVKDCQDMYRDAIKNHIIKLNGMQFINNETSFFPMFFTDDQIVLQLFSLSHYLADAHMPLHCDAREFSLKECGNIHGLIEEQWENWVIQKNSGDELTNILSESERGEKFLKICYNTQAATWKNCQYSKESILKKFDDELGKTVWEDRRHSIL